jgi:O-methyltransferase
VGLRLVQGFPELTDERDRRWTVGGLGGGVAQGVAEFHETAASNGVPRDAYTVTEGFFEDTLPPLGTDGAPNDIALAYVDCNMYASTKTVFDFLKPRLKHGMIVGFDDYYCYSSTSIAGERIALHVFLAENPEWNFCRFKDIHWCGLGFVVERAADLPMLAGGRVTT